MKCFLLLVMLFLSEMGWCADGDEFTVKSVEGVDVTYQVISEQQKTCQVGGFLYRSAIDGQTSGEVTIPASVNGYTVEAIGDYAFVGCMSLQRVAIPSTVMRIGEKAFYQCEGLTTMEFLQSANGIQIGNAAFMNCKSLQTLILPEGLEVVSQELCSQCSNLNKVVIPNSAKLIEPNAFYVCRSLKDVTIGSGVKLIGRNAFFSCEALQQIVLPHSA